MSFIGYRYLDIYIKNLRIRQVEQKKIIQRLKSLISEESETQQATCWCLMAIEITGDRRAQPRDCKTPMRLVAVYLTALRSKTCNKVMGFVEVSFLRNRVSV